uniref:Uncharacterized protein n=1 Tax=Angiostrongylus cantonensis TaxID=6313 RepID=A0A0K0CVE4_ANGCA
MQHQNLEHDVEFECKIAVLEKVVAYLPLYSELSFCNRRHQQSGAIHVVVARRRRAKQCGEPLPPIPKLALKPTTFTWLDFCNRRHEQSGAIHVVVARRRRAKQCGEPLPPIPKLALKPTTFTWLDFCNRRHQQSGAIHVVVARRRRAKQCGEPLPPIPKLALKPTTFTRLEFVTSETETAHSAPLESESEPGLLFLGGTICSTSSRVKRLRSSSSTE